MKQKTIATRHLRTKIAAEQTTGIGSYYLQNKKSPQGCTRGIYEGSGFIHDW